MATGNQYVPLTLELIEEGQFREDLDKAIAKAQEQLVQHVEHWQERATKAKAVVEMNLTFEVANVEDGFFSITPNLKVKLPARPGRTTAAMAGYDRKAKQAVLFVRDTGSTPGDPTQMHLPTTVEETEPTNNRSEM